MKTDSTMINYAFIGFGVYYMFAHFRVAEWISWLVVAVLFEGMGQVWNALIPAIGADNVDYFGGLGFSWHQWIMGGAGATVALLIDLMWPPHIEADQWPEDEDEGDDEWDEDDD